jgi:hypothetical protein
VIFPPQSNDPLVVLPVVICVKLDLPVVGWLVRRSLPGSEV